MTSEGMTSGEFFGFKDANGRPVPVLNEAGDEALRAAMAAFVKRGRLAIGLTQTDFAALWDKSKSWSRDLEAGNTAVPHYVLATICKATGFSVSEAYGSTTQAARGDALDKVKESISLLLDATVELAEWRKSNTGVEMERG